MNYFNTEKNSDLPLRSPRLCGEIISAFTLVEMMVVVAVIAVLILLFVPFMHNARERARSTSCRNNLRQYGIALAKYMSDYKGYFIYPGDGGGVIYDTKDFNADDYDAGIHAGAGGVGSSSAHYWWTFIDDYLPKVAQTNFAYLMSSVQSVRICPSVQMELKSGNYFDTNSPNFKGFRDQMVDNSDATIADFENLWGAGYDADGNLILASCFTTYAINNYTDVYRKDRTNISANTVAFIDWNAKEGWQSVYYSDATLYRSSNCWQFSSLDGTIKQDEPKWTTNWCLTEVGFHHGEGTNMYANYVAMDGHVASVTSNDITLSYFTSAGP